MTAAAPTHERTSFIPSLRAGDYLERFFVSAIAAVLLVRLYLYLTGFPQVGGKGLHIAHMLWGGVLMVAAIAILLSYLDRTAIAWASVLGGAGLGIFLDELGKFLTSNNNYFYKPAVAIMYILFVVLYLVIHLLMRARRPSPTAYVVNALSEIQRGLLHEDPAKHAERAEHYLSHADQSDAIVQQLVTVSEILSAGGRSRRGRLGREALFIRRRYEFAVHSLRFQRVMLGVLIIEALVALIVAFAAVAAATHHFTLAGYGSRLQALSLETGADLVSSAVAGCFVIVGLLLLTRSRLVAYRLFKLSVLITIFFTQIFLFHQIQFWALLGFVFSLPVLIALNTSLKAMEERHRLRVA